MTTLKLTFTVRTNDNGTFTVIGTNRYGDVTEFNTYRGEDVAKAQATRLTNKQGKERALRCARRKSNYKTLSAKANAGRATYFDGRALCYCDNDGVVGGESANYYMH